MARLIRALAIFMVLLVPTQSWAAVGFDAASNQANSEVTNITWSHATVSGATVIIFGIAIATGSAFTAGTVTDASYASVALTQVQTLLGATPSRRIDQWCLDNPTSGTNTSSVTISGLTAGNDILSATATTLTGTDTCASIAKKNTAEAGSGTALTVTVSSVVGSEIVVDVACGGSSISSVGADQTQRTLNNFSDLNSCGNIATSTQPGSSGGVMSWTLSASDAWAMAALAIGEPGGGGAETFGFRKRLAQ
jgi:hypothetical protein